MLCFSILTTRERCIKNREHLWLWLDIWVRPMLCFSINLREASSLLLYRSPSIFRFHTVVGKFQFHVLFYSILFFSFREKIFQIHNVSTLSLSESFYYLPSVFWFLILVSYSRVFRFIVFMRSKFGQSWLIYNLGLLSFD